MRFLLDQGIARSVVDSLNRAGHDALHVGECNLTTADDPTLLERARSEDRIIVTFDSDFSALMALSSDAKPSIVHIRIEGMRADAQTDLILKLAEVYFDELQQGAILSVQAHTVRLKILPIK